MIRRSLSFLALFTVAAPLAAQECHPGLIHLARGNFSAALKSLNAAVRSDGGNASLLNSRGVAELLNGKLSEASATFSQVLATDARFLEARFNRGIVHLRQNELVKAGADFEAAFATEDPLLKARAAYHRALVADAEKKLHHATTWLDKALVVDPLLSDAKLYRGVLLERRGEFQKAGEAYRDYLSDRPHSTIAMLRFGIVAHRAGYPDTAKKYLQGVVQRSPQSLEAVEARKFLVMWE